MQWVLPQFNREVVASHAQRVFQRIEYVFRFGDKGCMLFVLRELRDERLLACDVAFRLGDMPAGLCHRIFDQTCAQPSLADLPDLVLSKGPTTSFTSRLQPCLMSSITGRFQDLAIPRSGSNLCTS